MAEDIPFRDRSLLSRLMGTEMSLLRFSGRSGKHQMVDDEYGNGTKIERRRTLCITSE